MIRYPVGDRAHLEHNGSEELATGKAAERGQIAGLKADK